MEAVQPSVIQWVPVVRSEFLELPGLCLTKPQMQRLWGLDAATCDALLQALIDAQFLTQTANGSYGRADVEH